MTEETKAGALGQAAALPEYQFEPFEWVKFGKKSGNQTLHFIGLARDVSEGVKTVIQVLERDQLEHGFGDASPIFSPFHAGFLTRFVIAALDLLANEAERLQEQEKAKGQK